MLVTLRPTAYMLAALTLCGGCSVLFNSEDSKPSEQSPDATPGSLTEARIIVAAPNCGNNVYGVSGVGSVTPGDTPITDMRWTIEREGITVASFSGPPVLPVPASTHVLGGTIGDFTLNPSLFSAPELLRVTISGLMGANQVYEFGLAIQDGTEYDVSLVALSDIPGSLTLSMHEHAMPYGGMGLSEVITTDDVATQHHFTFLTTRGSDSARLRMEFNTRTGFWIDNIRLRQSGAQDLLLNERFDTDLEPWHFNFEAAGNNVDVQRIPAFLEDFPDTTINLVIVDSSGAESATSTTIDSSQCNE